MIKRISKIIFIVSMVLWTINLKGSYANDNNLNVRRGMGIVLPSFDVGDEECVRSDRELKAYIRRCLRDREVIHFLCLEEIMEARMLGYAVGE